MKTRTFDSLEQEAFLNLWRTYDRLRMLEDALFAEFDLTPQQYNVLRLLKADQVPTLTIAERLVSRAPDITRMLDKLEVRGLVRRDRSEVDRRSVLVAINASGLELLAKIKEPLRRCHERQMGHLSRGDLKTFVALLRKARVPHETDESSWL